MDLLARVPSFIYVLDGTVSFCYFCSEWTCKGSLFFFCSSYSINEMKDPTNNRAKQNNVTNKQDNKQTKIKVTKNCLIFFRYYHILEISIWCWSSFLVFYKPFLLFIFSLLSPPRFHFYLLFFFQTFPLSVSFLSILILFDRG